MAKTSAAQQRAVHKYVKNNYDRLELSVPKGEKATIQQAAKQAGQSVNAYIYEAVCARMQQENEKLKVMCDLNIDNSNLTGMKGKQQGNSPDVAQASTSGSANMESTKPEGMQSVQRGDKGSLAEQAAQKANESAQPR